MFRPRTTMSVSEQSWSRREHSEMAECPLKLYIITTPFIPPPPPPLPTLYTVSSPLAKPGKLLPLVPLSQEKKSGTNIQMITELGKPSLCPLQPSVPSLHCSAQLLISLSRFIWLQSRPSLLPWLYFEHDFICHSGWNGLFWCSPPLNDFCFVFFFCAFAEHH